MASSRILELANGIGKFTSLIHDHLASHDLQFPSFSPDASGTLPEELLKAQDAVLNDTAELHDLLMPPISALHINGNVQNLVSMNAICRFDMANSFAPGEETSFAQMAKHAGLSETVTKSLLRHAMTIRIFCEPKKGVITHTARSALFREPKIQNFIRTGLEEMTPAALRTLDALQKWPMSEEPAETGFALANNTNQLIYEILGDDPARAKRFADTMNIFTTEKGFETSHVISGFDWQSLGAATVVDIGGSRGHISIALAMQFPALKFVVQDFEITVKGAENDMAEAVAERVSFMAHDIFKEQTVVAHVYYFRWIFHNWSDKYSIKILRSLIPILRPGVHIIINDVCMAEPGTLAAWREKELRTFDLGMLAILNGRERDAEEWKDLFERADPRFHFEGVTQPEGSNLAMIAASWSG
ncbi:O-methyltransferase [Lachnellula hyalina]|uniref:O-methyltransferase n=1 Tax=Lachnellula hyalina TaxID=1316788 RepID=A0A8H8R885_9HELO|nr:O-methyltransferase [Lachnellula hyalina]TVY30375.1 O-methyltransferase [Lachnellula hyalina]